MTDKISIAVVTGGGNGIGRALCKRLHRDGASVVVVDLDKEAADEVAAEVDGVAYGVDVGDEAAISAMIEDVEANVGPIDLFASNAGVVFGDGESGSASADASLADVDDRWSVSWRVNVMAHVYAARALIPRMAARGKHAALGFAEAVAIRHGDEGIHVTVLCPQAVATNMLDLATGPGAGENVFGGADADGIATPEQVADAAIDGVAEGKFMITPHPEVIGYLQFKADDYDRWVGGMRKLRRNLKSAQS
jgi:NAD(P)-dependent dehydrogenase (short-subunit alcohol dehydrogenase family)